MTISWFFILPVAINGDYYINVYCGYFINDFYELLYWRLFY
jgi:hypothetical protein